VKAKRKTLEHVNKDQQKDMTFSYIGYAVKMLLLSASLKDHQSGYETFINCCGNVVVRQSCHVNHLKPKKKKEKTSGGKREAIYI
jgi:hypothetical protein